LGFPDERPWGGGQHHRIKIDGKEKGLKPKAKILTQGSNVEHDCPLFVCMKGKRKKRIGKHFDGQKRGPNIGRGKSREAYFHQQRRNWGDDRRPAKGEIHQMSTYRG